MANARTRVSLPLLVFSVIISASCASFFVQIFPAMPSVPEPVACPQGQALLQTTRVLHDGDPEITTTGWRTERFGDDRVATFSGCVDVDENTALKIEGDLDELSPGRAACKQQNAMIASATVDGIPQNITLAENDLGGCDVVIVDP